MATKGKLGDAGTREHPWHLRTPSGTSEFQAFRDETLDPPALVVKSGSTELRYRLRCINDLHQMLKSNGDWMLLGSADEQKPAPDGTGRSLGTVPEKPGRRVVRPEERTARSVRHVRSAGLGGPASGRGRAQPEEQPDAGALSVVFRPVARSHRFRPEGHPSRKTRVGHMFK